VQRIIASEVSPAEEVAVLSAIAEGDGSHSRVARRDGLGGPILSVEAEDLAEIRGVLLRAARSSYLELVGLDIETRPGELTLRARVYEPEEEYE
jgi:tRNA threonylcarbamoyladenosine modification (KEOPS) complex  Pcc1 subunit